MVSILGGKAVNITATTLVLTFIFYVMRDVLLVLDFNSVIVFFFLVFISNYNRKANELVDFYQAAELTLSWHITEYCKEV